VDFEAFLNDIRSSPVYRGQIVHTHIQEARDADLSDPAVPLSGAATGYLATDGIERLYSHQAEAIDNIREGRDVLIVTGTASGKSLCYQLPLIEMLETDPAGRALLLYPTKALSQDQCQSFQHALEVCGMAKNVVIGVFDGDTPANARRSLRDNGSLVLTNPDMLHAALLPQHAKWAEFLRNLKYVVIDELHTYGGLFGANVSNLMRRVKRVCDHHGSRPQFILCSATVGNPEEIARKLIERDVALIDHDGSPRGKKTFIFWNPPRIRVRRFKSRRSANVEAHELMAELIRSRIPTITFSKAHVTAELIYRYVVEALERTAPHLARKVTPYRGGYLARDRREIERKLFSGELLGVSTTRALELGIDVGGLDASIVVGYPGTLAGFFQQAGRAGRRDRESLAILVGIDTSINQYVMNHPEYIFGRPIERLVLDPDNPYILSGQLRCAAYELPIDESEVAGFGRYAPLVLDVLVEQCKLNKVGNKWYHASDDIPQHEVSLRDYCDANVAITDVDTGQVIGELNKFDAQPIIHPDAIYLHQGETYLVLELDLERNLCFVKRLETDYYTQPLGGTDVHHIDQPLRHRQFGASQAYFGEVTAYFRNDEYERIHFYTLDAISRHKLDLPTWQLETMALWITPSEGLVREMIEDGYDIQKGLMGIAYATRMILPLFIQCETLDFSHSSCTAINAPWHTMFIYERYPHGLGFTEAAFEMLADIMPAVYDRIKACDCHNGCPCCVGKPLRGETTWNIERGEANIPSKRAALRLLRGILGDASNLRHADDESMGQDSEERLLIIERGIRRRLEKLGDPRVFHPIDPNPEVGFPEVEKPAVTTDADVARRALKRIRLSKSTSESTDKLEPLHRWSPYGHVPDYLKSGQTSAEGHPAQGVSQSQVGPRPPEDGVSVRDDSRIAKDGEGSAYSELAHERPSPAPRDQAKALRNLMKSGAPRPAAKPPDTPRVEESTIPEAVVELGDSIASRARLLKKKK